MMVGGLWLGQTMFKSKTVFYKESIIQCAETDLIKQRKRKAEAVFKKADTLQKTDIFCGKCTTQKSLGQSAKTPRLLQDLSSDIDNVYCSRHAKGKLQTDVKVPINILNSESHSGLTLLPKKVFMSRQFAYSKILTTEHIFTLLLKINN